MKVIGIVGSSGSGKTTICEILRNMINVNIIDADKVARELLENKCGYLVEIKENFEDVISSDGTLNRSKLAEKIYNSKEELEKLNKITFKYVVPKIVEGINNAPENTEFVIIDAPLLFEAELDKYCDYIIAIDAPEKLKIERICKRDNITEETAKARLGIQNENDFYISKSDFVIVNDENTDLNKLKERINEIILKIKQRKENQNESI